MLARIENRAQNQPILWAVGGGKGGVGKSVVTANLAIALAARGQRVCVVDLDLGGANQHTLLGVPKPPRTLSHFLTREVKKLADVVCPTAVPGVSLVSGARALMESANPQYSQKQKILRHLSHLDVDHVMLDLGAGSSYNVLDFFLAAQRGILVTVPEPTSIENAYHFLKAAFFRSLRTVARHEPMRSALEKALQNRGLRRTLTPRQLIAAVMSIDPEVGRRLEIRASVFSPMLVVNQASRPEHRSVGREIAAACELYLGTPVEVLGILDHDASVPASVARQQPALHLFPGSSFAKGLDSIAARLLRQTGSASGALVTQAGTACLATTGLLSEEEPRWRRQSAVAAEVPGRDLPIFDMEKPGGYLRRCREHLGLGLAELTQRTQIRRLERLEEERFHELPPEPYVRGYVLQYAQALGIQQAEALTASFLARYRASGRGAAA